MKLTNMKSKAFCFSSYTMSDCYSKFSSYRLSLRKTLHVAGFVSRMESYISLVRTNLNPVLRKRTGWLDVRPVLRVGD